MSDEQRMPDLSQLLSGVMANPQALSMLSSLLGNMGKSVPPPMSEACREDPPENGNCRCPNDEECPMRKGCPAHSHKPCCEERESALLPSCQKSAAENRKRLLEALKPYLSAERCRALERILTIAEALNALRSSKQ